MGFARAGKDPRRTGGTTRNLGSKLPVTPRPGRTGTQANPFAAADDDEVVAASGPDGPQPGETQRNPFTAPPAARADES